MAKNSALKKRQTQEVEQFDLSSIMDSPDGEVMVGMMSGLIEASRDQMQTAIHLTRITVENNPTGTFEEKDVYSIFKRASKVVSDITPMKEVWDQMSQ